MGDGERATPTHRSRFKRTVLAPWCSISTASHSQHCVTGCRQWHRLSACWREGRRSSTERALRGVLLKCVCVCVCGKIVCVCLPVCSNTTYMHPVYLLIYQFSVLLSPSLICLDVSEQFYPPVAAHTNIYAHAGARTQRIFQNRQCLQGVIAHITLATCKYFTDKLLSNKEIKSD